MLLLSLFSSLYIGYEDCEQETLNIAAADGAAIHKLLFSETAPLLFIATSTSSVAVMRLSKTAPGNEMEKGKEIKALEACLNAAISPQKAEAQSSVQDDSKYSKRNSIFG